MAGHTHKYNNLTLNLEEKNDLVVALTTIDSEGRANDLAEEIIKSKTAACVSLLPGVTSIYYWQGNIERASEILLLIKLPKGKLPCLTRIIAEQHPYETPELLVINTDGVAKPYLEWVQSSCLETSE